MIGSDIIAALTPVIEAFEALSIPYLVGGSVATSAYGVPRATLDVDVVAAMTLNAAAPLTVALSDTYYVDEEMICDAIRHRTSFNLIHLKTMLKVDVFILKERAFDNEAFRRSRLDTLEESKDAKLVHIASPEDMILHKLEWYRKGDELSERQWRDVLGVIKVQDADLDHAYLRRWADDLGLLDLLERAFAS